MIFNILLISSFCPDILKTSSTELISPRQLHRPPVKHHIDFKIPSLTFKALHKLVLLYLSNMLHSCHL